MHVNDPFNKTYSFFSNNKDKTKLVDMQPEIAFHEHFHPACLTSIHSREFSSPFVS